MQPLTCQYCRQRFTPTPWEEPVTCPHCGEELTSEAATDTMRTVARVSNLAEVGYFEEVLQAAGIETKILEHDDYNAVSGDWSRTYVLRVDQQRADEAVTLLERALAATTDVDDTERIRPANTPGRFTSAGIIALLGGAFLVLLYIGADHRRDLLEGVRLPEEQAAGPRPALWRALAEEQTPLSSPLDGKRPRRRIYYDQEGDIILLEEDRDGDGRIDRTRGFRGAGVVFDRDW
ncbi:MAG: hypothetical protein KF708_18330 [Pirellulales bacterium]|nr:hypothetical protein [Pirellulales bacterium]